MRAPRCCASIANRAVKMNVVPAPGTLSKVRSPAMSRASRRLIASPRPVPPYRRDVELSACMNASNSLPWRSSGMPMPVSRTVTRRFTWSWFPFAAGSGSTLSTTSPCVRELEGVSDKIREHLAETKRVANKPVGDRRDCVRHELDVLLDDRRPEGLGDFLEHVPHAERRFFELQLAGLDLREVQDVVEDAEQVARGRMGDADVLMRLRAGGRLREPARSC